MDLGLAGKVALVAGASSGLGRAVAEQLAREGAKVIMAARRDQALADAAAKIREATKTDVVHMPCDLTSPEAVETLVFEAGQALGPIEILVTNAGWPPEGGYFQLTDDDWLEGFQANFLSTVLLCRNVVPGMKAREWGRIVMLSAAAARQPMEGELVLTTLSAGARGFGKSLSAELAGYGITVNSVLAGRTETQALGEKAKEKAGFKKSTPQDIVKAWSEEVPMGRLGKPNEIASAVAFLASSQAGYITGQGLAVDGGWTKGY